ncbi:MAG: hypothetical protein MI808_22070 [Pseudomonadales bacterium]|nr:hypothetical protein [Pseudomonadales bacterium]
MESYIGKAAFVPLTKAEQDPRIVHNVQQFRGLYQRREENSADFLVKRGGRIFVDIEKYQHWLKHGVEQAS